MESIAAGKIRSKGCQGPNSGGSILRNSRHLLCKTIADSPPTKTMKLHGSDLNAFVKYWIKKKETSEMLVTKRIETRYKLLLLLLQTNALDRFKRNIVISDSKHKQPSQVL